MTTRNDTTTTTKSKSKKQSIEKSMIDAYVDETQYENDATRERVRSLLHALSTSNDARFDKKIRRQLRALHHTRALTIVIDSHIARTSRTSK